VTAIYLPPLPVERLRWSLRGVTKESGPTDSGVIQVGRIDGGGWWEAAFEGVLVEESDEWRTWQALESQLDGGATSCLVTRRVEHTAPWPLVGGVPLMGYAPIPHDDGTFHDDGSGYYQPVIDASIVGSAALRATSLVLRFVYGGPLRGGETFSINHPVKNSRMYRIGTVVLNDAGDSVVTFRPPLREAVTDGTPVEFDRPRCLMRLSTPDGMDIAAQDTWRGSGAPVFVEV